MDFTRTAPAADPWRIRRRAAGWEIRRPASPRGSFPCRRHRRWGARDLDDGVEASPTATHAASRPRRDGRHCPEMIDEHVDARRLRLDRQGLAERALAAEIERRHVQHMQPPVDRPAVSIRSSRGAPRNASRLDRLFEQGPARKPLSCADDTWVKKTRVIESERRSGVGNGAVEKPSNAGTCRATSSGSGCRSRSTRISNGTIRASTAMRPISPDSMPRWRSTFAGADRAATAGC